METCRQPGFGEPSAESKVTVTGIGATLLGFEAVVVITVVKLVEGPAAIVTVTR